ncbi:hypothetical protein E2C01_035524 [Portunus trituberculatus]|uniref:Uncharacterized protein n=1 Tax=Portunus trituberculatus TaxID=210409 RepID=A0A5B7FBQ1_PORTR|nr:hypothetical protein [Portunus trituberculatus]
MDNKALAVVAPVYVTTGRLEASWQGYRSHQSPHMTRQATAAACPIKLTNVAHRCQMWPLRWSHVISISNDVQRLSSDA